MSTRKLNSSKVWRSKQKQDGFVQEAARLNVRSRAYFKIEELDCKFHLFKVGYCVLDLGAAPGSWAQYTRKIVGETGKIVAIDKLEMKPLPGVEYFNGDITSPDMLNRVIRAYGERSFDLVMSDMAPNISGNASIDAGNFEVIRTAMFGLCEHLLRIGGSLVFKIFNDSSSNEVKKQCQKLFEVCEFYKPKASRVRSSELYIVAKNYQYSS